MSVNMFAMKIHSCVIDVSTFIHPNPQSLAEGLEAEGNQSRIRLLQNIPLASVMDGSDPVHRRKLAVFEEYLQGKGPPNYPPLLVNSLHFWEEAQKLQVCLCWASVTSSVTCSQLSGAFFNVPQLKVTKE